MDIRTQWKSIRKYHEKEADDIYCNDVSKDGDYLLLTHSKDVDYEIINLNRFERVRVRKVEEL